MATETVSLDTVRSNAARGVASEGWSGGPDTHDLVRFLGWFSIGLGACEILAPGSIARISGSRDHKTLVRSYGLREVATGVGILTQPHKHLSIIHRDLVPRGLHRETPPASFYHQKVCKEKVLRLTSLTKDLTKEVLHFVRVQVRIKQIKTEG